MIYELRDVKTEQFWLGCVFGGLVMALVFLALERLFHEPQVQPSIQSADVLQAYKAGKHDALKTNPAGADLELACLTLWSNKQ
jgi:hypothetical protein